MQVPPPRPLDGRYLVVRGRLWRASNPHLDPAARDRLVRDLLNARRAVGARSSPATALRAARRAVDAGKVGLGEGGPAWWDDSSPDYNRHLAENTPYAEWYAGL